MIRPAEPPDNALLAVTACVAAGALRSITRKNIRSSSTLADMDPTLEAPLLSERPPEMSRHSEAVRLVRDTVDMSVDDVVDRVLMPLGLHEHRNTFYKHKIDGHVLRLLTDAELKELVPIVGDRVRLAAALSELRNSHRSVQRNRAIMTWKDSVSCWAGLRDLFTCSTPFAYKLTSTYIELDRTQCGRSYRETIDLGDVSDVTSLGPCCCLDCFPCPMFGCGLHSVSINMREEGGTERDIVSSVEKSSVKDVFNSIRNAWEQHHNRIQIEPPR